MSVHVFAPAGERWKSAWATPEPPSAEFEDTATAFPRTIALEAGAVRLPVGFVASRVTVNVPVDVSAWPLVTVTVWAPLATVAGFHVYAPWYGLVRSSPPPVMPAMPGKLIFWMPESASLEVASTVKLAVFAPCAL